MYVVLQGIGSLPCIRVWINSLWGVATWMSEVPKLENISGKKGPLKWSISFYIVLKKWVFQAHLRLPPRPVPQNNEKNLLCNENQWNWVVFLYKKRWIFPLRLIFYVCSSARNWVSSMYKGMDGIDQFPLGSSDPGCLKFLDWNIKKTPGHPKW